MPAPDIMELPFLCRETDKKQWRRSKAGFPGVASALKGLKWMKGEKVAGD